MAKMVILGWAGQSNAEGFGERAGPNVPPFVWQFLPPNNWTYANDVAGGNGSMRPNFGSEFYNLTGHYVMFVKNSINGGFQTDAANAIGGGTPDKSWDVNGTAFPTMIANLKAAKSWAISVGLDARHGGTVWSQSEADANGIAQTANLNPPTVTRAIYLNAAINMTERWRSAGEGLDDPDYPFYIIKTGALSSALITKVLNETGINLETGYAQTRDAQEDWAAAHPRNLIASRMALAGAQRNQLIKPFAGPDLQGIHWNQDLNDAIGLDAARRIHASGLWNRW